MAILKRHIPFYQELFKITGFLSEPFLMVGYQNISGDDLPKEFAYGDLKELLLSKGIRDATAIDLFDPRADLRLDLNLPVANDEHDKYAVVFDVGSLEHVFDTRQCLENCMRMVRSGGYYFLHTPVHGYLYHGLHTFSPELVIKAFKLNGFEIVYQRFCSSEGTPLRKPEEAANSLMWIAGKKKSPLGTFQIPQQEQWAEFYAHQDTAVESTRPRSFRHLLRQVLPPILFTIYRKPLKRR